MIRAVIDTNVIISGLFWRGNPNEVIRRGIAREFLCVTSPYILKEVEDRLIKKFKASEEKTKLFIALLVENFEVVVPKMTVDVVADKKDNKIIEAALEANADYIVTGDDDLLRLRQYGKITILKPKEFLRKLRWE